MDQNSNLHYLNKPVNLDSAIEELNCSCTTNKDSLKGELLLHRGQTCFPWVHKAMAQNICIHLNHNKG